MADDSVLLTDYHVFKFCSPSRTQMLTGRYAYHLGQQTYMNLSPDGARCGINTTYKMLPALLSARGYRTYGLGKWHLGFFREEYTPIARGFDRFVGFYTGGESHR
jgi:arylsulfatase A-like enzyme